MEEQERQLARVEEMTPARFNFFDKGQFEVMQRVSNLFAHSELVPDMYKATDKQSEQKAIANCMLAIEMSQRMGASPLMVMQNLIIIYGRPSWSSKFLISTVNTCGRFNTLKYRITNKGKVGKIEYTDYAWNDQQRKKVAVTKVFDGSNIDNLECVAYTTEKGSTDTLESSPISIALAIKEGWYTKAGSKWQTMPEQMLRYRAASFWTNAYAPELSMGMRTDDEVRDIVDAEYEELPTEKRVKKEIDNNANKEPLPAEEKKEEQKETSESNPLGAQKMPEIFNNGIESAE